MKKGVALKILGEKSCEIKGGGQQMSAVMLILTMRNFKAAFFSQLGCFCVDGIYLEHSRDITLLIVLL